MNEEDAFLYWLAGFIDGEGSFGIYPAGRALAPRFTLILRDDDQGILEEIVQRTGLGCIRRHTTRPPSRPRVTWHVESSADQQQLVRILDAHPLRAKKARDYAVWREAVMVRVASMGYGEKKPLLAALRGRLEVARAYP